jgi:hypothetical protein
MALRQAVWSWPTRESLAIQQSLLQRADQFGTTSSSNPSRKSWLLILAPDVTAI